MELSTEQLFAARLLRLISEAEELAHLVRTAHGRARLEAPVSDAQEMDLRTVEGEFAVARRALKRLIGTP